MSITRVYKSLNLAGLVFLMAWQVPAAGRAEDGIGAPQYPTALNFVGRFTVTAVVDGDTLALDDDREVRLTGIQAPKLPLGRANFPVWPLAPDAKAALEGLAIGKTVSLFVDGAGEDRYGRVLAHPVLPDGRWLQAEMVKRGMARVYSFADNRRMADALYALEVIARENKIGIWNNPFYEIRSSEPEPLLRDTGTFQVVEGRVVDAAKVRSRVYLNFGSDFRIDFTASVTRQSWSMFEELGLDPVQLEGKRIRVRGWIRDFNGPLIEVTHPEQIERVSP